MRMWLFLHTMPQERLPNLDAKDTKLPIEGNSLSLEEAPARTPRTPHGRSPKSTNAWFA